MKTITNTNVSKKTKMKTTIRQKWKKGNKAIIIISLFALTIYSCSKTTTVTPVTTTTQSTPPQLTKAWEVGGLNAPESVVLDSKNNVLYVSNVTGQNPGAKDRDGYISKVGLDGSITELKWVTGLNSPKGLVIYNDKLYVTDIDTIVEINISTKAKTRHAIAGATFLNDIVVDASGNLYASNTFGKSGIFQLSSTGTVTKWLEDDKLERPNGLYISDGKLFTAGWGSGNLNAATFATDVLGRLISVDMTSKAITNVTEPIGNLDGLSKTTNGYLTTDWRAGKVLYYSNSTKKTTTVLTLTQGCADTYLDDKTSTVYIPSMNEGKLLKYTLKN